MPQVSRDVLIPIIKFLYSGLIPCQDTQKSSQILNDLTQIFGFPSRMKLNVPKVKCRFCGYKYHLQEAGKHMHEEIESIMKNCKLQLREGKDIVCELCKISIDYRRMASNKEETIRNHYINLHSGDMFCNLKEKTKVKIKDASSKNKAISKSSTNLPERSNNNGIGLKLKIDLKNSCHTNIAKKFANHQRKESVTNNNLGNKIEENIALKKIASYQSILARKTGKVKPFCNDCKSEFENCRMFFNHFRSKHREMTRSWLKCVCGKIFPNKNALQRHQQNYRCGKSGLEELHCQQETEKAVKMHKQHMSIEHPDKKEKKTCSDCHKKFHNSFALDFHVKRCKKRGLSFIL